MTEEQIERTVAARTDRLDARYMRHEITTADYESECDAITRWAEAEYRHATPAQE